MRKCQENSPAGACGQSGLFLRSRCTPVLSMPEEGGGPVDPPPCVGAAALLVGHLFPRVLTPRSVQVYFLPSRSDGVKECPPCMSRVYAHPRAQRREFPGVCCPGPTGQLRNDLTLCVVLSVAAAFLFYCPDSENRRERVLYAASKVIKALSLSQLSPEGVAPSLAEHDGPRCVL